LSLLESFVSLLLLQALHAALAHLAAGWVAKLEGLGLNWGSDSFQYGVAEELGSDLFF